MLWIEKRWQKDKKKVHSSSPTSPSPADSLRERRFLTATVTARCSGAGQLQQACTSQTLCFQFGLLKQSPCRPQFTYCNCGMSPLPSVWWGLNHNSWEAAAVQGSGEDRGPQKSPPVPAPGRFGRWVLAFHCWLAYGISCLARHGAPAFAKRKNWERRRKQTLKNDFSLFLRSEELTPGS